MFLSDVILTVGESVEFDMEMNEEKGKPYAANVTGPDGVDVLGVQRDEFSEPRGEPRRPRRR